MLFTQVLCRSLGSTNFMQPHSFLPPEFIGNERLRCGSGNLAPMSLSPWVERDPFHKEGDFPNLNLIQQGNDIFTNIDFEPPQVTSGKPTGNLDFETFTTKRPTVITSRPKPTTVNKLDNKLDIPTSTTSKPKKKRTTATTRRPATTIIDNKLDFLTSSTTKRPDSPFSKLGKDSPKVVTPPKVKRSTTNKRQRKPKDVQPETDDLSDTNLTLEPTNDELTSTRLFSNDATEQTDNYNDDDVESKTADDAESRLDYEFPSNKYYDNDYDYGDRQNRPTYDYSRPNSYYPTYPPLTQSTSKRPVSYQNNRPNYQNSNYENVYQPSRPTGTPISIKYSTPFSYDTYNHGSGSISSLSPQMSYDNMAIPLYISPNRVSNRPSYQTNYKRPTFGTTRKMDLSTFMIIETTRRSPTSSYHDYKRTTQRPNLGSFLETIYKGTHSTKSPISFLPFSSSSFEDSDDSTNLSHFILANTNQFSIKKPTPKPFNDYKPALSVFSHDLTDATDDDFDGYLRPETSFYVPLKTKHKPTYNDYSMYNNKPESSTASVKYYYIKNVLHKYYEGKSEEENVDGLYDHQQSKRYAEFYDEHFDDKNPNEFISQTRTLTDRDTKDNDEDMVIDDDTVRLDGRAKHGPQNVFLVPIKLLTKIDRPDNWLDKTDHDEKSRLPEVPALSQDGNVVARELPRPIFGSNRS